jgi:hypothetical protein
MDYIVITQLSKKRSIEVIGYRFFFIQLKTPYIYEGSGSFSSTSLNISGMDDFF